MLLCSNHLSFFNITKYQKEKRGVRGEDRERLKGREREIQFIRELKNKVDKTYSAKSHTKYLKISSSTFIKTKVLIMP